MQLFQHGEAPYSGDELRHYGVESTRTKVRNQARTITCMQSALPIEYFDHLPDSFEALRANLERLLAIVPKGKNQVGRKPKHARIKALSASGQRNIMDGSKSPTLETLDKISRQLKAPGWLLVHPDMKEWDQHRPQIMFMIRAYLTADEEGRDAMFRVARAVGKSKKVPA